MKYWDFLLNKGGLFCPVFLVSGTIIRNPHFQKLKSFDDVIPLPLLPSPPTAEKTL